MLHHANTRGFTQNEWLSSYHSFSFADYHDPDRMGFAKLRVLNDDTVAANGGFGFHRHSNMEIVSIPLSGSLLHRDNIGNEHVINSGDVQIMSAGQGIKHSEYNNSAQDSVNFLQIWILPKKLNIKPRYEQKTIDRSQLKNNFAVIVSPFKKDSEAVWINQDALFSLTELDEGSAIQYIASFQDASCYIFVIKGEININDDILNARDALALSNVTDINITAKTASLVLCIETT